MRLSFLLDQASADREQVVFPKLSFLVEKNLATVSFDIYIL